jgi:hypothetical protein
VEFVEEKLQNSPVLLKKENETFVGERLLLQTKRKCKANKYWKSSVFGSEYNF